MVQRGTCIIRRGHFGDAYRFITHACLCEYPDRAFPMHSAKFYRQHTRMIHSHISRLCVRTFDVIEKLDFHVLRVDVPFALRQLL